MSEARAHHEAFLVFAYTWKCGRRSRCTHTMRARTYVSVVVCVALKLRPCPSYSGRRERNNSVHWRSLYKGGGGTYTAQQLSHRCCNFNSEGAMVRQTSD